MDVLEEAQRRVTAILNAAGSEKESIRRAADRLRALGDEYTLLGDRGAADYCYEAANDLE